MAAFSKHHPNYRFVIHIFDALMEGGWHNPISTDLGSSEQKIVERVNIDYVTRHF